MDIVTVLRVEDGKGVGPFSRRGVMDAMHAAMGDRDRDWHEEFPTSIEMFAWDGARALSCGTETAREIVTWFPAPMRDVLAELGYGLSVYRVEADAVHRADGAMQVVFDRARATRRHRPFADRRARRIRRKAARDARIPAQAAAPPRKGSPS